jgi:NAD(P)-dependent dehydrogenase (short-subunit alcohol dehydrogenase family)
MKKKEKSIPPQSQGKQPGLEHKMNPQPEYIRKGYKGSGKLKGKVALITGGDSGIGRAVAVHFAREGADVAIVYLNEDKDADKTQEIIEREGSICLLLKGDIRNEAFCQKAVKKTVAKLGKLDILVNNAAVHYPKQKIKAITSKDFLKTYETNVFGYFHCSQAALDYLPKTGVIINTSSVTAFRGSDHLVDYASTKAAIIGLTRAMANNLVKKGIRVNAVAPGPIWTPLIPASFDAEEVKDFGKQTPMGRPGQPSEVAPAYVFLASADASYITGQVVHVNGGEIVD